MYELGNSLRLPASPVAGYQSLGNYLPQADYSLAPNPVEGLRLPTNAAAMLGQGSTTTPGPSGNWFQTSGFLGSTDKNGVQTQGWGMPVIAAGQGLMNAFLGMQQYGLFKDQLNESKRQFGLNFDAQKRTTNAALEDRQRARLASNPGAYQSVGDYMAANGIRG